jgi:benzodiazapine receptor
MNSSTMSDFRRPQSHVVLLLFLAVVLGVGLMIGITNEPGEWYAGLDKPFFNPPSWVFSPVWTILYILIAIAGWRVFMRDRSGPAMKLWYAQMALNWLWSPVMFSLHLIWPAFGVIVLMLATIIAFIIRARQVDALASWLFVPYLAWVGFASVLNLSLAILN